MCQYYFYLRNYAFCIQNILLKLTASLSPCKAYTIVCNVIFCIHTCTVVFLLELFILALELINLEEQLLLEVEKASEAILSLCMN